MSKCFSYVIGTTYIRYAIHLIFGRVVLIELFRYAVEFVLFNRSEISYISMQVTQLWHFRVEWRCSLALIWEDWRIRIADQHMMMAAIFFSMKLAFLFKSKLVLPYEKQSLLEKLYFLCFPGPDLALALGTDPHNLFLAAIIRCRPLLLLLNWTTKAAFFGQWLSFLHEESWKSFF